MKKIVENAVLTLMIIALAGGVWAAREVSETYPVSAGGEVEIEVLSGSITGLRRGLPRPAGCFHRPHHPGPRNRSTFGGDGERVDLGDGDQRRAGYRIREWQRRCRRFAFKPRCRDGER